MVVILHFFNIQNNTINEIAIKIWETPAIPEIAEFILLERGNSKTCRIPRITIITTIRERAIWYRIKKVRIPFCSKKLVLMENSASNKNKKVPKTRRWTWTKANVVRPEKLKNFVNSR